MKINVNGIDKIETKLESRKPNSFIIDVEITSEQAESLFYQLWDDFGDACLREWLNKENKQMIEKPINHTFIREGKEKSNTKIVTTPKPNICPAPQSHIKPKTDEN